jgi:hypothetical protein
MMDDLAQRLDTQKMRACAPLLPPPGDEVVVQCLDEIERLRAELAAEKDEVFRVRDVGVPFARALEGIGDE